MRSTRLAAFVHRANCNSSFHPISAVETLYIGHRYLGLIWKDDAIENSLWLQLLLPFTAVKNIYLSKELAPGIAAALQNLIGVRIMEVLPNLSHIFVKGLDSEPFGPVQENIRKFAAARELSDHPIAISVWNKDSESEMQDSEDESEDES